MNLLKKGYVADDEIERFPGVTHKSGSSGDGMYTEYSV